MMSAHEATASVFCDVPGCPFEAESGETKCAGHLRRSAGRVIGLEEARAAATPPSSRRVSSSPTRVKWTREKAVAAIREVGEKMGRTPSRAEMSAHGYATVPLLGSRLGCAYADLVREAGFEPNTRGVGHLRRRSGREPQAAPSRGGVSSATLAGCEPTSRPETDERGPDRDERGPDRELVVRDPIRTADVPYDASILEDEARFLRMRANALEQIAGGLRALAGMSAPPAIEESR